MKASSPATNQHHPRQVSLALLRLGWAMERLLGAAHQEGERDAIQAHRDQIAERDQYRFLEGFRWPRIYEEEGAPDAFDEADGACRACLTDLGQLGDQPSEISTLRVALTEFHDQFAKWWLAAIWSDDGTPREVEQVTGRFGDGVDEDAPDSVRALIPETTEPVEREIPFPVDSGAWDQVETAAENLVAIFPEVSRDLYRLGRHLGHVGFRNDRYDRRPGSPLRHLQSEWRDQLLCLLRRIPDCPVPENQTDFHNLNEGQIWDRSRKIFDLVCGRFAPQQAPAWQVASTVPAVDPLAAAPAVVHTTTAPSSPGASIPESQPPAQVEIPAQVECLHLGVTYLRNGRLNRSDRKPIEIKGKINSRILHKLMAMSSGQTCPRGDIERCWPETPANNTLDAMMKTLRERLEPIGLTVKTIKGEGYQLVDDAPPDESNSNPATSEGSSSDGTASASTTTG